MIEGYQLSPQQRRLWALGQRAEAPAPLAARCAVRVAGPLDPAALRRALFRVVARHEALRTTFPRTPGLALPLQAVSPEPLLEWREVGAVVPTPPAALALLEEQAGAPLDLSAGPVLSAWLAGEGKEWVLALRLPALCADARTLDNLVRELAAEYAAERTGVAGASPGVEAEVVQYAQYAEWQRELLAGEGAAKGAAFWRERRERAAEAAAALGALGARRAARGSAIAGAVVACELAADEFGGAAFDREHALAAWAVLLGRLTGAGEVGVWSAEECRKYEELGGGAGPYAAAVPVCVNVHPSLPFAEVVRRVREAADEASEWLEFFTPDAEGERAASPHRYGFEYREEAVEQEAGGVTFSPLGLHAPADGFALALACRRAGESLKVELRFDPELFAAEDVERIAQHFRELLRSAAERPEQPVGALNLLGANERRRLLFDFNQGAASPAPVESFQKLFEEQARRTPERAAVASDGRFLTYRELNERANQLAHYLRRRGVGPDVPVGLCLDRSAEMVTAVVGILKAGGAYLPLDADHPAKRLAYQLSECAPPVLVTEEKYAGRFAGFGGEVVCVNESWRQFEGEPTFDPPAACAPDNLAYVVYTSGSTGEPKGVAVTLRGLANYCRAIADKLGLDGESDAEPLSFATVSTLSADLGNTCVFPSLLSGGCLHVLGYEVATDGDRFARYLAEHRVAVLKIVPSHLGALLAAREAAAEVLPRRLLVLGGEPLPFDLARRVLENARGCRLFNHYGPTETTVGSLACGVSELEGFGPSARTVPIGRPLAGTRVYVFDGDLNPAPVGVAGELYIGGAGVARGYVNKAGQTAQRFVPDPFSGEPGARLYRTGDLVRHLPCGEIEFVGRADGQVKINGFRLELGEVEAALRRHPSVREAVVAAREDGEGRKRLVAYVVTRDGRRLAAEEARGFLRERVPQYMTPAAFVTLRALPLTRNGKVDRAALPEPEASPAEAGRAHVEPRGRAERQLADIFRRVLRVERVGVEDNFFDLGGDSILSIQITARANQAGLRLTPRDIFTHQTVAALARAVEAKAATTAAATDAEQGLVTGEVVLTPIQRWFFERELRTPQHFNQALMLVVEDGLTLPLLARAVGQLLLHHDALRMRFVRGAGGWKQFNAGAEAAAPPVTEVDLSGLEGDARRAALARVAEAVQASLDLSEGPLLRFVLVRLGAGEGTRLLAVIHHLVVDGVSWRVLVEDLRQACGQLRGGGRVRLAPKTCSFRDWAAALHDYAQTAEVQGELDYWTGVLAGAREGLPLDMEGGDNSVASAATVEAELDERQTQALLTEVARAHRAEAHELLLAGLCEALGRWSGRRSFLVEAEGHGREELAAAPGAAPPDTTRTVGWLTTHYPLLLEADEGGVRQTLKRVKESARGVPRRGFGYGLLRYLSEREEVRRAVSGLDAEVSFNYMGQVERGLEAVGGWRVAQESPGANASPAERRSHLLKVNAAVSGGRLRAQFTYSTRAHERATVEALARDFAAALRELAEGGAGAAALTPSDFPQAKLSQGSLDKLLSKISSQQARRP